jgi:hypothetical protein
MNNKLNTEFKTKARFGHQRNVIQQKEQGLDK